MKKIKIFTSIASLSFIVAGVMFMRGDYKITSNKGSVKELRGAELLAQVKNSVYQKPIEVDEIESFWGGQKEGPVEHPRMIEQCLVDEQDYQLVEKNLVYKIERALRTKNTSELNKILSNDFKGDGFPEENALADLVVRGNLQHATWLDGSEKLNSENFRSSLNQYLSKYKRIDDFNLDVFRVVSPYEKRDKTQMRMEEAALMARFDLRGETHNSVKRNDRGFLRLDVVKSDHQWLLRSLEILKGETVASSRPSFKNATASAFSSGEVPVYLRKEAIRRGGYALALDDYDSDGAVDLYVGAYGEGVLFRGDGNGKFKKVIDSGLGDDRLVKTAIFADFFNQGRKDLVLVRFVPHSMRSDEYSPESDIVFYRQNQDGKFEREDNLINNRLSSQNAMPAAVADFNGNGFLDLYVGFPGPLDFTFIESGGKILQEAVVQGLYLNNAQESLSFNDRTELSFAKVEMDQLFAHSSIAYDYDMNGTMDLLVLDDRGNLSPIYENQGDARFYQRAQESGLVNSDFAMGVAGGDLDNDGLVDFAISNVNFVASERFSNSCFANWHGDFMDYGKDGLRIFKGIDKGKFVELKDIKGIHNVGEGLAGVEFFDYDNDGLLDIYVTNGLWSGTDREQDLSSLFVRALHRKDYVISSEMADDGTQSDFMNILNSFEGDLKSGKSSEGQTPSMAGHQRNRLFKNLGNNEYLEVGYVEGVDSISDGYIASVADLNGNGKMDLILRNGDPGVESVRFPAVEIFMNTIDENKDKKSSLIVELVGKESNNEGIGAFVEARVNKMKMIRHLVSNNGPAQSEKILHFGLGKSKHVDSLKVLWPSGRTQTLTDIPAGRIKIYEDAGKIEKIVMKD